MPIKVCKLCFKDIKDSTLINLFNPHLTLCSSCYQRLKPKFIHFKVDKYNATSFYDYDGDIKSLLYQLKGCFDYELGQTFLDRYFIEMRLKYLDFILIPIPSYYLDDEKRGFNHVEEIFRPMKLKMMKVIEKTEHFKQADHNKKERGEISKYLSIVGNPDIKGKKVLIVDDVYTTGSTMKAAIKLIEKLHPKKIEILVMAKTIDKKYSKKDN